MSTAASAGAGPVRHLRVVDAETVRVAEDQALESARERALGLLTSRPRTRSELATALQRRGVDDAVAVEVLDRLTGVGLLDDAAYARAYAEREGSRKGPRAVADALRRRGVPAAVAQQAAFGADPADVRATALAVGRRALPRWRGMEGPVVARRLTGLLARRGYDHAVVRSVAHELLANGLSDSSSEGGEIGGA